MDSYRTWDYHRMIEMLAEIEETGSPAEERLHDIQEACSYTGKIPSPPHGSDPSKDFYFIRRDARPEDYDLAIEKKLLVMSIHGAREHQAQKGLPYMRGMINAFYEEHSRYPSPLEEAFSHGLKVFDPLTVSWDYNPETGEVRSPSFPDL